MPPLTLSVCCVPGCSIVVSDGVPLHYFPNPETFAEKYQVWVKNIGGDIASLDSATVFKKRRICHRHFETQFFYAKNRLSKLAVPTLLLRSGDISVPQDVCPIAYRWFPCDHQERGSIACEEDSREFNSILRVVAEDPRAPVLRHLMRSHCPHEMPPPTKSPLVPDCQPSTSQEAVLSNPVMEHSTTVKAVENKLGSTRSMDRLRPRQKRKRRAGASHKVLPAINTLPGNFKPQPGPSGPGPVKREPPDDTASLSTLQGDAKRVGVHFAQAEQGTYARATKNIPAWLAVAICFPTLSRDLTKEDAEHIKMDLENLLMETDSTTPLPAFRGYPRVAEGTVQMWCEDDNALTWLTQNVPRIRLPDTDLTLTVLRQSDVPTRVRASLFVPSFKGDVARLQSILIRQNTWYDVARWSLYRATTVGGDNGIYLTLGLPPEEVEKILVRGRRMSYLLGSIYVRFWPTTHPSDIRTDSSDTETNQLEEVMARAVMADDDTIPPTSPGWNEKLLVSLPGDRHDDQYEVEKVEKLSDGTISD